MNSPSRRLFLFRTRVVLVCTLLAVLIGALDVWSRYGGRTLILPLSDRSWVVANAWDGLLRFARINSTRDSIDVSTIPWNPDVSYVRIAKADQETDVRLTESLGYRFRGIDEASGYWAGALLFARSASVPDWSVTWRGDLVQTLEPPDRLKKLTLPPPVYYDLLRFPLWPFAVSLFVPAFLRGLQRVIQELRIPLHQCRTCCYDLTGNTSGVCSECGTPVHEAVIAAPMISPSIKNRQSVIDNRRMVPGDSQNGAPRILDANFNRAREALRVMEEYARFVLDDASLAAATKVLRHDLVEAMRGAKSFFAARDIVDDVGCEIGVESEYRRESVEEVVVAAGKRLSEALRVIEEYGKVLAPELGVTVEQFRYRGYEIERRLAATMAARERFGGVRLYVLLTESLCKHGWFETAEAALLGGAECIQLRENNLPDAELLIRAKRLTGLCRKQGAIFIVNDRPDIALAAGADGVHVGQDDFPVAAIRRILPPSMIVGVSTHTLEQARAAIAQAPDYIAVGPMFDSPTKPQDHIAGIDTLAQVRALTGLPLVAIGGITLANVPQVVAAANCAICVCQAVIAQHDVNQAARALRAVIDHAHQKTESPQYTFSLPTLPA